MLSIPQAKGAVRTNQNASDAAVAKELRAGSDVLTGFLGLIVRLSGARAGAVRTLSEDRTRFELVASVGLPSELRDHDAARPANCGICGIALQARDVQRMSETAGCRLCSDEAGANHPGHALAVPLLDQEHQLGVLNLFFRDAQDVPDDAADLLRPFGPVLGLALDNERLARENLSARLANERQAMAAEIHDALAQSLSFARMRMSLLRDAVQARDPGKGERYCTDIDDELREAQQRLREMIRHFRAGMDGRGLLASLRDTVAEYSVRRGIELRFDCKCRSLNLSPEQELQVFHIVREALANVCKHSGAQHARLTLERKEGDIRVMIEDDGCGISATAGTEGTHHGLQIMRERAHRAGGRLEVDQVDGGGLRVCVTLPEEATPRSRR